MVDSKHQWKAWLYLAPAIILLLLFTVWPIVNTLIMAFSDGYSMMKNQRTVKVNTSVTVYGNIANYSGGVADLVDGRFCYEEGIEQNDDDLIQSILDAYTISEPVAFRGVVVQAYGVGAPKETNGKWTFALEVTDSEGNELYLRCKDISLMTYEFGISGNSRIYLTGKVTKNGGSYVMKDAVYVADINTTTGKRSAIVAAQDEMMAKVTALADGETSEQVTLATDVSSIDKIVDRSKVNITVEASDTDSQSVFIECPSMSAKERSGAKIGGFFVGINNFKEVLNYAKFGQCLANTLILTVLTVPLSTFLALLIAVCLNAIKPLQKVLQTIFFLPYVTNSIAIGMVFATMFNMVGYMGEGSTPATIGIINNIIEAFGGTRINWINQGSSYAANLAVMVIYIVWNALPFKILILLGGLQSVNKQYYDAAKVDGTSRARTFWRITVPLLSPMIAYVVITGFIGGFKEYSSIVGIFGADMGPAGKDTMNTMVGFIYRAIQDDVQGKASAAALILFVIILAVTLVNLYVSRKKVHY